MPDEGRAVNAWCPDAGLVGSSRFTLKRTRDFLRLFQTGRRFTGDVIKARYGRNTLGVIRLGFSVSRKTGGAVSRNLFRRRLRYLARENAGAPGFDAVVTPLKALREIRWAALRGDFENLLRKARE